jgi:competence CoiA-like predicted nuclease
VGQNFLSTAAATIWKFGFLLFSRNMTFYRFKHDFSKKKSDALFGRVYICHILVIGYVDLICSKTIYLTKLKV